MPSQRTSRAPELLIELDREHGEPLHRQLERGLRDAVRTGRLAPNATLPSSRDFARQLAVSRGVVVDVFEQLAAEGYLVTRPGGATRVASTTRRPQAVPAMSVVSAFRIDLRPGRPDLDQFPRAVWSRSVRRVLETTPSERFGYLDGRGVVEVRSALATYLARARGVDLDPDDVVIATGFFQGVRLIAEVLVARGVRAIGIEDPSDPDYRVMLAAAGLRVVGIPVDDRGLRVDALERAGVDAVLVTPSHQYPTGGVLSPDRRVALVDWATRRGGWIIEDDYDAEFRYDREPIGAIQGLRPDRVIYAGSASKVLAPGLRLGWLVAPSGITADLTRAKRDADGGSPVMDQLAFADLLDRGELDRHLRRMRPMYRRRRDALLGALARHLPALDPVGASAGLHLLAWLPDHMDETSLLAAAEANGIAMVGVGRYHVTPPGRGGVIFGYGRIEAEAIDGAIAMLAQVILR